jgi:hypothetical protein
MDAMRPPPVGDQSAVRALRSVIFTGIDGAAVVYPRGYSKVRLARLIHYLGPLFVVHATDPLPASPLYIAVTPDDFRILGRAMFSIPFEIGRWKKGTYRASIAETRIGLKLDLELERLGRVRLLAGLRAGDTRPVFDLVVQGASGPVIRI